MKLLIVDGSNMVMRAALGDKLIPPHAAQNATNLIKKAIHQYSVTHMVIALDTPGVDSWRKTVYPAYKANRDGSTAEWIHAAHRRWNEEKWFVIDHAGYEADDIIATVAVSIPKDYALGGGCEVLVMSADSDLLPLTSKPWVRVLKPVNGGNFELWGQSHVCNRYGVTSPRMLIDLKAMTGESGDNIPGVEGIGPVRAKALLAKYSDLDAVISAGQRNACKDSIKVYNSAVLARLSMVLVTLDDKVPLGNMDFNSFAL